MLSIWLHYNGPSLILHEGKKSHVFRAFSGAAKTMGRLPSEYKFDYSPGNQKNEGSGPIPEGKYFVVPSEISAIPSWKMNVAMALWSEDDVQRYMDAWGQFRVSIHPMPGNDMAGRPGGFFIHGGMQPGSAGCIDLTDDAYRFFSIFPKATKRNPDEKILLIVNYTGAKQ